MYTYAVWYMRPEFMRDGIRGYDWCRQNRKMPSFKHLNRTHVHLKNVEAENLDDLYGKMQCEIWSPNGEARKLLKTKGLQHTSMSVGDIAVLNGATYMVDRFGFERLS